MYMGFDVLKLGKHLYKIKVYDDMLSTYFLETPFNFVIQIQYSWNDLNIKTNHHMYKICSLLDKMMRSIKLKSLSISYFIVEVANDITF